MIFLFQIKNGWDQYFIDTPFSLHQYQISWYANIILTIKICLPEFQEIDHIGK